MTENEKDYFVPEQLDDNDFEKEKMEAKQARKGKKFEFQKKHIAKIGLVLVVIALIGVGIYLYLNPIEKKATAPEKAAEDFCAYFNAGNWKKVNNLLDLKGYYVLGAVLEEPEYTKFDTAYKNVEENDEKYIKFEDRINVLMNLDDDVLESLANIQIRLKSIDACNQIQGTKTLYKLRVTFDYIYNGQGESATDVIYISNASGKYKMVYGEWMQTVLNYYQSVYMIQSNYGY